MMGCDVFWEKCPKEFEEQKQQLPARRSIATVLTELIGEMCRRLFANCVREWRLADVVRVSDGDVLMLFVKSEFIREEFYPSLDDNGGTLNVPRARGTEKGVMREERVYAGQKLQTQKMLLNSLVPIQKDFDENKKV